MPERPFKYVDVSSVSNTTFEIEKVQELLGRDAPSRARRHIQRGDVLFATIRPTLKRIAIVPEYLHGEVCSTGYFVFRPKPFLDGRYLFYYLMTSEFMGEMEKLQTGASYPAVNDAQVKSQFIQFPALAEQERIVAILDEAFEGIAKATANAERNLANARELFVRAIAKRLAEVPVERIAPVRDLASDERGAIRTGPFGSQLLHSEFVDDGPIAVLGIDNVVDNEFAWKRRRYITAEKYAGLQRYTVKPGDVLISIMGTCGRCAVVPDEIEPAINSKHLCCITLDRSKCLPAFLHTYFLLHPTARAYLAAQSKGSIMDGLNMGIIQEMPIELPSLQNQRTIGALAKSLREKSEELVGSYEQKCARYAELRKALLRKAFSGQLIGKEAIAA